MSEAEFDVDELLGSVDQWRRGVHGLSDLFVSVGVDRLSDDALLAAVRPQLAQHSDLVQAWQQYSYDKRWTPSPYLDGVEVGHYDGGKKHVRRHATPADACADFVVAEVRWVVDGRVIEPD